MGKSVTSCLVLDVYSVVASPVAPLVVPAGVGVAWFLLLVGNRIVDA